MGYDALSLSLPYKELALGVYVDLDYVVEDSLGGD
jgi:hypothetical protein